jgi:hypothetical protein
MFSKKTGCCSGVAATMDTMNVTDMSYTKSCIDRCRGNGTFYINTNDTDNPQIKLYLPKPDSVFRDFALGTLGNGVNVEGKEIYKGPVSGGLCGTGINCSFTQETAELRESIIFYERTFCCCCFPLTAAYTLRHVKELRMFKTCCTGGIEYVGHSGSIIKKLFIPSSKIEDVYAKSVAAHKQRLLRSPNNRSEVAAPSQVVMEMTNK